MLAFPEMLAQPAKKAGMKVPEDLESFDKNEYPHWFVYQAVQLGAPMPHPQAAWDNAQVIAEIPEDELKTLTYDALLEKGVAIGYTIP